MQGTVGVAFDPAGEFVLPATYGRAIRVPAGGLVRVTNIFGTQAVDFWVFNVHDLTEYLSMDNIRSVNSIVFVTKEVALVSNLRRRLVSIVEDSSAGHHDTLLCACNAAIYREHGVAGYHRSCADNLHEALAAIAMDVPFTPAPLNLFMSVHVRNDGTIERLLPASKPGSSVVLRAEMDAVLVFSSCPQDVTPINGPDRTPRDCRIEIVAPAAGEPVS
jgi:uncharacterized protein YcgI (DUF1989 family)